jgi:hypothetical protein
LPEARACAEPAVRLLALRLTLTFLAGGAWGSRDRDWVPILLRHLEAIGANPAEDARLRGRQGALAALALSVLRSSVPRFPETVESHRLDRAGHQLASLLDALDDAALTEFCGPLTETFGGVADPDAVLELALDTAVDDPIEDAISALGDFGSGIAAHRHGNILVIPDGGAEPAIVAFLALRMVGTTERSVVQAGQAPDAVVLAWMKPKLYMMRPMTNGQWRAHLYRLPGSFGPETYSGIEELPNSTIIFPKSPGWPEVVDALAEVGLDVAELPPVR